MMIMRTLRKYLSVCLTLCVLFSAVCIFPVTAETPAPISEDGDYVWVVRSYELKESDFAADSAQIGNIWLAMQTATSPGNIAYDKFELLCDGIKVETIDMRSHVWQKGDAISTFAITGSAVIPKGHHILLFKFRLKATDMDTGTANFAPFQLTGTGFSDPAGYWIINGSNMIGYKEMQEGTPGYNDAAEQPDGKQYVRVSRTWSVAESQYTGESGVLNFNCNIQFQSLTCPADVQLKAMEIVCDGELVELVDLTSVCYTKGEALEAASPAFYASTATQFAKGDHTFIFTFILSVENADAAWLNETNGIPLMVWSPAISGGAGIWVATGAEGSPLISVKEMMNGTATNAPYMEYGASVRLADDTGLRFKTVIGKAYYDAQVALYGAENVKVGTLIAPAAYVKEAGAFTAEALDVLEKNSITYLSIPAGGFYATGSDVYTVAGSILNIRDTHYTLDFAAIGFVEVNGVRTYSSDYVVRNIAEIASAALDDVKLEKTEEYSYAVEGQPGVFSPYTTEERAMLAEFCQ